MTIFQLSFKKSKLNTLRLKSYALTTELLPQMYCENAQTILHRRQTNPLHINRLLLSNDMTNDQY